MFTPSNAFIFAPMFNQPPDGANRNGNDATGAFQPGAQMFANFCTSNGASVTSILFNNHAAGDQRRNEILHNGNRSRSDRYNCLFRRYPRRTSG